MLQIKIPHHFFPEKEYIIKTILNDFLDYKTKIFNYNEENYQIILENDKKITINDAFFKNINPKKGYLYKKNIPAKISFGKNQFLPEENIPIIYGNNDFIIKDNEIICGLDIFASAFFMLTRWEEYVNKSKDEFDRFPAQASLAYKHNFLHRPIVNEYAKMLENMLQFLKCPQKPKKRKFKCILTHDIDIPLAYKSRTLLLKIILADIIKRKDLQSALKKLKNIINFNNNYNQDPYNLFDYLMNISKKAKTKSHFYFMSGGKHELDFHYDLKHPFIRQLIAKIQKKGHIIGFHPSFDTYNNHKLWQKEYISLQNQIAKPIKYVRQHFLRFEVPTTWQIIEDNHLKADSSMGYSKKEGFRAGTCYEYRIFNILTRKKLKLEEYPLIVMENSIIDATEDSIIFTCKSLIDKVKKYNGNFVLLWHNHLLPGKKKIYQQIIKYACEGKNA